jgi:hypothetical protein
MASDLANNAEISFLPRAAKNLRFHILRGPSFLEILQFAVVFAKQKENLPILKYSN